MNQIHFLFFLLYISDVRNRVQSTKLHYTNSSFNNEYIRGNESHRGPTRLFTVGQGQSRDGHSVPGFRGYSDVGVHMYACM